MARSLPTLLGAVARPCLLPVANAGRVERAADDLVTNAGEIPNATRANEHDRVLLEVVPDARDVGGDLDPGGQANAGDLAERGVRLLGSDRLNARADAPPLRGALEGGSLRLVRRPGPAVPHELLNGGHGPLVCTLDLSTGRGGPSAGWSGLSPERLYRRKKPGHRPGSQNGDPRAGRRCPSG